jgi:hypothetical protein
MPATVVILDESAPVRDIIGAMLRHGGFAVTATDSLVEARRYVAESVSPVVLLLSSTLAAQIGNGVNALVNQHPGSAVALLCTRPVTCPMLPGLPCPELGCIHKPDDMIAARIIGRVRQILQHGESRPPAVVGR